MLSKSGQTRVTQLDGLRGIAALLVVACHVVSTLPGIGGVFSNRAVDLNTAETWAVFSPLHILWNGTPAVHVFFVLSGFVLVLPFTRPGAVPSWAQYYAKRFFRLYLPAWASLAAAVALIAMIPRTASPLQSAWADMYVVNPTVVQVLKDGLLMLNASTINTPLWSLKWEVAFSLLLPAYVFLALRWRRVWFVKIGLALLLAAVGGVHHMDALIYLPIFAVGAVLGVERERIRNLTRSWPRAAWFLVAAVGLFLANAEWVSREEPIPGVEALVTVGAALIVLLFVSCGAAKRLGDSAAAQWLGRVSFSLYLVHLPIILAGVTLFRSVSLPLALAISVAASFAAAELFYRYVEQPAHRLSMAVGRAVGRRIRQNDDGRDAASRVPTPAGTRVGAMAEAAPGRRR
ncbi:acyltransferase [Arthrobacter sp. AL08]|uniref:acyltransferase family protein n=1 Tax=unclassified Arthrobacter TaxID=235627 RepID=UPI00249B1836|nr:MULTISPECIES: acyltransferase [unclassified Arthrobacter]MDI3242251.1 acyltransferase [Arthrobacter sp. AL05]MDI3278144.1 acyltransferase [Arthrobacter sp. AL08]